MKKVLALLLALAMIFCLAACGQEEPAAPSTPSTPSANEPAASAGPDFPTIELSVATSGAEGSNFAACPEKFSELLSEATGGKMTAKVYTSDQLTNGDTTGSIQCVSDGTIDMAFQGTGICSNYCEPLALINLPFIFKDYDAIDNNLYHGEAGALLASMLEENINVKVLGFGENGYRYLTNSKRPVTCVADLKGLKIRAGASALLTGFYEVCGADWTTAAWSEVYTALQTGLYEGQENPVAVAHASGIQEVQKYVTKWFAQFDGMCFVMNADLFNSWSPEVQAIVQDCATKACDYQVELTRQLCDEYFELWVKDYGMEVTELTPEATAEFKETAQPLYEEWGVKYQDIIDALGK